MTSVVFETAALRDVLKKAESIAPTRGHAFDKAAGIVITLYPEAESQYAVIQATNLDLWYKEWVPIQSCDATEVTQWRVAAKIAAVVATLPIGSGKTVELTDSHMPGGRAVTIKSGRLKNNWQKLPIEYYPEWDTFDPDELTEVENFGNRIAMVEWAASSNEADVPMNGVYFDGQYVVGCDGYKMARVPLPIKAEWLDNHGGITIPARGISTLLRQTGTVSVGATDTQLLVMPDPSIQIRTSVYGERYRAADAYRIMGLEHDGHLELSKAPIMELLNQAMVLIGSERFPLIDVFIGKSELAVRVVDQEESDLGNVIEVNGAPHKRINYIITPKLLIDAIEKCPGERLHLHYSTDNPRMIMRISNGGDYNAWVIPRKFRPTAEEKAEEEKAA